MFIIKNQKVPGGGEEKESTSTQYTEQEIQN